jgi:hypothetical protein
LTAEKKCFCFVKLRKVEVIKTNQSLTQLQIMSIFYCYLAQMFGFGLDYWFVSKKPMDIDASCYKLKKQFALVARDAKAAAKMARIGQ